MGCDSLYYLVVFEDSQLNFPVLVLDLLGSGVILLLPLLSTTPQSQHKMEGGFLLDVVIGQSPSILQLFTGKDQPLLIRGNSLLVLNLSLDIFDGVARLNLKGDPMYSA